MKKINRKEYAWGLYKPGGFVDAAVICTVCVIILVAFAVVCTPSIWMPASILGNP